MRIYEDQMDYGVQNDGMSDQQQDQGQPQRAGGVKPSSAKLNRERHERILLLKEKQDNDRLKKLEELKEQAMAAARLREEQDSRRKKHFEELVKKEDDRRKQAEERRKMLDEERKLTLQAKWEKRATPTPGSRPQSTRPIFAFGSCTPRLIDNHVDGFLWKSQYNLNVTREPGMRASSAHDLHIQQPEVRTSASMYDWNQQRTTLDNPLVHRSNGSDRRQLKPSRSNYDGADAMRLFCGRRKTDLTPTIPIKREVYDMSASMMSRSTSRGSGRVYSSMTRLDRSKSPGGNLSVSQHQYQPRRPSRSKSTNHLSSTGLKLTRTEILRQALAKKESNGFRSVDPSRPPSSMSSSIMTSSMHSQVQMRPRTLTRKSRPASVPGVLTGVYQDPPSSEMNSSRLMQRRRVDTSQERKPASSATTPTTTSRKPEPKKLSAKLSPSHSATASSQPGETSTIKRPIKKPSSVVKEKSAPAPKDVKSPETGKDSSKRKVKSEGPRVVNAKTTSDSNVAVGAANTNPFSNPVESELVDRNVSLQKEFSNVNETELVATPAEVVEVINNSKNQSNVRVGENQKVIENFESIESAFASGSDDFSSKTPEPFVPTPSTEPLLADKVVLTNNNSAIDDLLGSDLDFSNTTPGDFNTNILPVQENTAREKSISPLPDSKASEENLDLSKPKIMTEEQAKAAIAEKRRVARETAEREEKEREARIAEEQRLEEERQRLEVEEADRVSREAREAEEERLRKAIEEQQKREAEEKARKEEEEKARLEKEQQDRDAAKEAERIRLEMEERLKREEDERLERRKRVEAIMARTRKKEAEQQAKSNSDETKAGAEPVNGHKENNVLVDDNVQLANNSLNNNYNNNNDFGNNSTLIEFDGMGGQESNNLIGDSTTGRISTSSTSNPLMSNPVQDLLS